MPIYTYINTETKESLDVFLSIGDMETIGYRGKCGDEDCWEKQLSSFAISVDSSANLDPFDNEAFNRSISNKSGSMGDIMDLSAELSEKRAEKAGGEDPVQRATYDTYEEKNGVKHHDDRPKKIETDHVVIDFNEED